MTTRADDYLLTFERIRNTVSYDPATGEIRWKRRPDDCRANRSFNTRFAGKIAGTITPEGYRNICFSFGTGKNVVIAAQRVAMALMVGRLLESDEFVDHENGNRLDNRKLNLRLTDAGGNSSNAAVPSTNTSGFKGAHHVPNKRGSKKWLANISVENRTKFIGYFRTAEDAAKAYDAAAIQHYGEFARTNASLGLI